MGQKGSYLTATIKAALLASTLLTVGCMQPQRPGPQPAPTTIVAPREYGSGVYYFDASGDLYYRSLAAFLKEHPELRCTYAGGDDLVVNPGMTSSFAYVSGHAIMCTDTSRNAQDETVP